MKLSKIKIIAGQWRGRWIEFPDMPGLRPTPNRVRETLFNWLMMRVAGAHCLDAFSGSGALSFEALSRGATKVVAFEKERMFTEQIKKNAQRLQANYLELITQDFFQASLENFVKQNYQFDLVFLDPPFQKNLLIPALQLLIEHHLLAKDHRIYFEVEKEFDLNILPANIEVLKNQVAGQVRYGLLYVKAI